MQKYCGIILLLLAISLTGWAGGSKAAYRNYYLGNYYFSEGDYLRALRHLEKAHHLNPEDFHFNVSLALALGRTKRSKRAQEIISRSENLLDRQHPDRQQLLAIREFVAGMINCYDQKFYRAIQAFNRAIKLQKTLGEPKVHSIMLNALAYARVMDQGKGTGSHGGLGPHWHLHRRDLEKGVSTLRAALEQDPTNAIAAKNYRRLCDTLKVPMTIEVKQDAKPKRRYVSSKYKYLPANMDAVLEMNQYEEFVFLLDISGSMVQEKVGCVASDRFNVMKETALFLLENTADTVQIGLGTIGGDCGTTPKQWIETGSISRKDMRYTLGFLYPDGTTPLLTILRDTPSLFSDKRRKKSIFFISDGENVCNLPGVDICEWAETLSSQNISINIMTFLGANLNNTNAFAEYTCLAENTGGRILYLDANRCSLEQYSFDLLAACQPELPEFRPVNCWGPSVRELWAIFPNEALNDKK